ncbi:MAG: M1 family aminopeptidase [Terriglobia bacterium]
MNPRSPYCLLLFLLALLPAGPGLLPGQLHPYGQDQQPSEESLYARSREFDQRHLRLELSFDLPQKKVIGQATLALAPIRSPLQEVVLDSIALSVESVTLAGKPLAFQTRDTQLHITLDRAYPANETLELVIRYHAQPRRGLFFIAPDEDYPNRPRQIWSQGYLNDNRRWFPSYDFPNDKLTSELLVTVPANWVAISNGRLVGVKENKAARTKTWHWRQDKPHSTYLISLVAAEYEPREETWNGIPLSYYVPPGAADQIPPSFGRTANMMEFYSRKIAPYPWDKYAQSVVEHFTFGGMENTSATTMARHWIYPAALAPDIQVGRDAGIAHELVHQWFGDLVTGKDWRHFWLNEGFATYFASLWVEHYYGADEFAVRMQSSAAGITRSAAAARYPIVRRPQGAPGPTGLLVYAKGSWVLHMLRHQLGDENFWKAIRHYVDKYRFRNVDTDDFLDAIAEATGQNFEWLFDQYVYGTGHPEFEVAWDYDRKTRLVHLAVKQTQQRDAKPAPFRVPVDIEITSELGSQTFTVTLSKQAEELYFPSESAPLMVLFDKGNHLLKALNFKKSLQEWLYQLAHPPLVVHRIEAAQALAQVARTPEVLAALERAATHDPFYAVRTEVARTLGKLKGEQAQRVLEAMTHDADARVRSAAAAALGQLDANPALLALLERLAREDASFTARSQAIRSLGRLKPPDSIERLRPYLQQDSPHELVRRAAVTALGALGDDKTIPLLLKWSARGKPDNVRLAAINALGRSGRGNAKVRTHLVKLLDDPYYRVRAVAVSALRQRRERAAVPALEALIRNEWHDRVARSARRAIEEIQKPARAAASGTTNLTKLRQRLAELEKENKELRERLKQLEKRMGPAANP